MESIALTVGGVARRYLLHRPPASPGPLPLVVMLHGTGGSAAFAADETGWANFADRERFLVAFPDGLPVKPTSPPSFLTNPQRWNDGSARPTDGDPLHTDADDVSFLDAVIDDAVSRGADRRRVYLCGFSNGAAMTFRYAAERGDRLAAIAPVAGYCHRPGPLVRAVPTLYVVGDSDLLIPLGGGPVRVPWKRQPVVRPVLSDVLADWAEALGCEPTPRTVSANDGVTEMGYPGPVEFRAVVVEGLGHHWPGGKGQFNVRLAGPPSARLNGNERVWAFFSRCNAASGVTPGS
jgi:polyhydroxybutyrate depolymerase